jgi:hypothetical protein
MNMIGLFMFVSAFVLHFFKPPFRNYANQHHGFIALGAAAIYTALSFGALVGFWVGLILMVWEILP